jgi:WD40 repeat protein
VRLWDPATGQLTATLEGHAGSVRAVAFSPDGRQLATASDADNTVRLWDPATGQPTATLEHQRSRVFWVAFSPDGRQLATASYDGTVRLWDVHDHAAISSSFSRKPLVRFQPFACFVSSGCRPHTSM